MVEAYLKSDQIVSASPHKVDPDLVVLNTKLGGREVVELSVPPNHGIPVDKDKLWAGRNKKKRYYEKILRANILLSRDSGAELLVSGKRAIKALEVLLSLDNVEDKTKALEAMHVFKPGDTSFHKLVSEFRASEQLSKRLEKLKQSRADAAHKQDVAAEMRSLTSNWEEWITKPEDVSDEAALPKKTTAPQVEVSPTTTKDDANAVDASKSGMVEEGRVWGAIITWCGVVIGIVTIVGMLGWYIRVR